MAWIRRKRSLNNSSNLRCAK